MSDRPKISTGWSGGLGKDRRGVVPFMPEGGDVACGNEQSHSYHCLHITTADIPRSSIFNLGYGVEVRCLRLTGWQLFVNHKPVAGEYDEPDKWLILDVGGVEIVNSRDRRQSAEFSQIDTQQPVVFGGSCIDSLLIVLQSHGYLAWIWS